MSVDKFGRHSRRKSKNQRGPKGEGFNLTPSGDYDIKRKRLQNVDDPVDNGDAVNLKTFHSGLLSCIQLTDNNSYFDAQSKIVRNSGDPVERSDLVTKGYVDERVPIRQSKSYSFHQFNIKDVAYPQDSGDAVNLNYIKDNCIWRNEKNIYDAKGGIISNLRDPSNGPEAATKTYVDSKVPFKGKNHWSFLKKRLVNVALPIDDYDVTTLGFVKQNCLCSGNDGFHGFDAKNKVISNVAIPQNIDDVVNKRFLKDALADLGYAVYYAMRKERGRVSILHKDVWKPKVFESSWDDLFK